MRTEPAETAGATTATAQSWPTVKPNRSIPSATVIPVLIYPLIPSTAVPDVYISVTNGRACLRPSHYSRWAARTARAWLPSIHISQRPEADRRSSWKR
jgi:hypothetical protein